MYRNICLFVLARDGAENSDPTEPPAVQKYHAVKALHVVSSHKSTDKLLTQPQPHRDAARYLPVGRLF